jgi:predicted metalloprotease
VRWTPGNRSNIEDMRGRSGGRAIPIGIGGFVVLALLSWATGTDFLSMVTDPSAPTQSVGTTGELRTSPEEERVVDFVDAVADDAQSTWERLLGNRYERTKITLFRDSINSACGFGQAATGPFYCPGDRKVYLDLGFFRELSDRLGAPGDFAAAYVIAHELGHHVQHLLGTDQQVWRDPRADANSASVALELQADCYAGVWGHAASSGGQLHAGRVELDPGDADEALRAAASIGDDRLQKSSTGRVAPDRFTHGTSAQRMSWFKRGMDSGDPRQCNTFASVAH